MPEYSQKAKQIFDEARRLPPELRSDFLDSSCADDVTLRAQVEALLQSLDAAGMFLESPTFDPGQQNASGTSDTAAAAPSEKPGTMIGRYKLLQLIGEGGFGRVFMAEQTEPVVRKVALKIIKLGMDTRQVIARFEAERQALAMMDHPSIAKVLDAGATPEGRPFFVMELVRGEPITEYCDKNNLSVPQRLELFSAVCNAVQHAHQKGIIHRDIKPNNVLVTIADGRPVPKVIDFGIAKATSARLTEKTLFTEFHHLIGTPAYMSPEQAEATGVDIDTRSDIYSLGVLLYELLTGTTPFDAKRLHSAAYGEIQRIIREEEPPKPSTRLSTLETLPSVAAHRHTEPAKLSKTIRGDLDWIVMKCLEKDRTRRYETASALAQDVQRHMEHEPVLAGPPSRGYRVRKFVRRHRIGVLTSSAIAAALVLGVIGTTSGLVWAVREAKRAEQEAEGARLAKAGESQRADELAQVAEFQSAQFERIDPPLMGTRLRAGFVADAADGMKHSGLSETDVATRRTELEDWLSRVSPTNVALNSLYENIFVPALKAIDEQFMEQPIVRARLLQSLATTLSDLGLVVEARAPQTEALTIRRRLLTQNHPDVLESMDRLGFLLQQLGYPSEAERYLRESLQGYRALLGDDDSQTILAISNLSNLLQAQHRFSEAEPLMREQLERSRRTLGEDHPNTLAAIHSLAALLYLEGRFAEAEPYTRDVLATMTRDLGPDHANTLTAMGSLGTVLSAQGKFEEAEPYVREALAQLRRSLGDEHPDTVRAVHELGMLLREQDKAIEAEACFREALERSRLVLGDNHPRTLRYLLTLVMVLYEQGRFEESERHFQDALDVLKLISSELGADLLRLAIDMGDRLRAKGRLVDAEEFCQVALDCSRQVLGKDHPDTLIRESHLGTLLGQLGRLDEAETHLRAAFEGQQRVLGAGHPETGAAIGNLAMLERTRGNLDEAASLAREALPILQTSLGEGDPHTLSLRLFLVNVLHEARKLEEAQMVARQAVDAYRANRSKNVARARTAAFLLVQILTELEKYQEASAELELELAAESAATPQDLEQIRAILQRLVTVHESWNLAEPGKGHDAEAINWQARLEATTRTSPNDPP